MKAAREQTPGPMVRWLDRWRYLGAIGPIAVLLLIGERQSKIAALDTAEGFARYMVVVTAFGLGAAVTRPLHNYLQHRYRPWEQPRSYKYRRGFYGKLVMIALAPGMVVGLAILALVMLAEAKGLWPWSA